jgi:hypothetical protein
LTRIFSLHACASLQEGDSETAKEDVLIILKLAEGLGVECEPLLVEAMVSTVLVPHAMQVTYEGLSRNAWSAEQLSELQNAYSKIHLFDGLIRGLENERCLAINAINPSLRPFIFLKNPLVSEVGWKWVWRLVPSGWYYQNCVTYAKGITSVIDLKSQLYTPNLVTTFARLELESGVRSGPSGPYSIVALQVLPAFSKVRIACSRASAYVDMVQTACALGRYQKKEGRYPDSLAALVPEYLKQVPLDIINGQPLSYKLTDNDRYTLYSVGLNGVDDQGQISSKPEVFLSKDGDWVWKLLPL